MFECDVFEFPGLFASTQCYVPFRRSSTPLRPPPDLELWVPKVWRPHPAPPRHAMRARVHHLNRGDRRKRQAAVRELSARA